MGVPSLVFTGVVLLNCVDISWQGSSYSGNNNQPVPDPQPSAPSTPRRRRRPYSQPRERSGRRPPPQPIVTHDKDLVQGSLIIRNFDIPLEFYYKSEDGEFQSFLGRSHVDAVLNYEKKVVAVFLQPWARELRGLYYHKRNGRVKLTPACVYKYENDPPFKHYDFLDAAGISEYPEFTMYEKPEEIIINSIEDYLKMGIGVSCTHRPGTTDYFRDLYEGSHIVSSVKFEEGFYFRVDKHDRRLSLVGHLCDAVVDRNGHIVAVFLAFSEHVLYGLYHDEYQSQGNRIKLLKSGPGGYHFTYMTPEEIKATPYSEFRQFRKPKEIYRKTLEECGFRTSPAGSPSRSPGREIPIS